MEKKLFLKDLTCTDAKEIEQSELKNQWDLICENYFKFNMNEIIIDEVLTQTKELFNKEELTEDDIKQLTSIYQVSFKDIFEEALGNFSLYETTRRNNLKEFEGIKKYIQFNEKYFGLKPIAEAVEENEKKIKYFNSTYEFTLILNVNKKVYHQDIYLILETLDESLFQIFLTILKEYYNDNN